MLHCIDLQKHKNQTKNNKKKNVSLISISVERIVKLSLIENAISFQTFQF